MKKLLLFTLLATLAFSCRNKKNQEPENTVQEAPKSTAPYKVGQTMYVHALLGLSLRKAPDAKAEKVGAAQYGEGLEILALPEANHSYVAE